MSYEVDRVCHDDTVIATHPANQREVGGQEPSRPGRDGTGDVQRVHRLDAARGDGVGKRFDRRCRGNIDARKITPDGDGRGPLHVGIASIFEVKHRRPHQFQAPLPNPLLHRELRFGLQAYQGLGLRVERPVETADIEVDQASCSCRNGPPATPPDTGLPEV